METSNNSTHSFNVGASDYSKHKVQPWDIWEQLHISDPWLADIIKRILRHKATDDRALDLKKIIHICKEKKRQESDRVDKLIALLEGIAEDYKLSENDRHILAVIIAICAPCKSNINAYEAIITLCEREMDALTEKAEDDTDAPIEDDSFKV